MHNGYTKDRVSLYIPLLVQTIKIQYWNLVFLSVLMNSKVSQTSLVLNCFCGPVGNCPKSEISTEQTTGSHSTARTAQEMHNHSTRTNFPAFARLADMLSIALQLTLKVPITHLICSVPAKLIVLPIWRWALLLPARPLSAL